MNSEKVFFLRMAFIARTSGLGCLIMNFLGIRRRLKCESVNALEVEQYISIRYACYSQSEENRPFCVNLALSTSTNCRRIKINKH